MRAGQLRHRITIQEAETSTDPFQADTEAAWNDILICRAAINTVDPKELFNNGLQGMRVSHIVTIRYPGLAYQIGAGNQIVFGTRVFEVVAGMINKDERNRQLDLYAWEINPTQGGQRA